MIESRTLHSESVCGCIQQLMVVAPDGGILQLRNILPQLRLIKANVAVLLGPRVLSLCIMGGDFPPFGAV